MEKRLPTSTQKVEYVQPTLMVVDLKIEESSSMINETSLVQE